MTNVAALWDEIAGESEDFFVDDDAGSGLYGGSSPGGIPFLTDSLTNAFIIVEAAFGADINSAESQMWNWTDITADVRQADGGNISITIGRSDENSQASPASCSFQLDNTNGFYSANNPAAKYWPNLKRNTPIRVRLYTNGIFFTRFQGQANGWVPSWDTSANLAIVTVSASGKTRQLGQGKSPLKSPLVRAVLAAGPKQYWPLDDGSNALRGASALPGGVPLTVDGTVAFSGIDPLTFGANGTPPITLTPGTTFGFGNVPQLKAGGALKATFNAGLASSWSVQLMAFTALASADTSLSTIYSIAQWTTTDGVVWRLYFDPVSSDTTYLTRNGTNIVNVPGAWVFDELRVDAFQSGGNISVTITRSGTNTANALIAGTLTGVNSFTCSPDKQILNGDWSIAHVRIFDGISEPNFKSANLATAFWGYFGEITTDRLARLCEEEGIQLILFGPQSDIAMGEQTTDTFVNLIRECETADDGMLFDGIGSGLAYTTRKDRYNAASFLSPDVSLGQLGDPFEPVDDDQRNRNLVRVDQKNGSSATFEDTDDPLGTNEIGTYESSVTVNYSSAGGLYDRAAWEVHKGTAQGFRYPTLNLDLAAVPAIIPAWLATPLSGRIDVLNVASKAIQHPPGTASLLLEGYSETLTPFDWSVTANCSPYDPWRVAVIEGSGDTLCRINGGASTLLNPASMGDTSITVTTTDGHFWSTSASDYPQSVDAGGIQVTVSAVGAASGNNQTFTISALAYPIPAGSAVKLWRPATTAL